MRRVSAPMDRVAIIGAGESPLVAELLDAGYRHVHAVDISPVALDRLRSSLGDRSAAVTWVQADVRTVSFEQPVDVWHDRATLHFLTEHDDRGAYARQATASVRPGGHVIIAEFAPDGPQQCSGLPVARDDLASLATMFGIGFTLVESFERDHVTPWGAGQRFLHAVLRRRGHLAADLEPASTPRRRT